MFEERLLLLRAPIIIFVFCLQITVRFVSYKFLALDLLRASKMTMAVSTKW